MYNDANKYNIQEMGLTETHIKKQDLEEITVNNKKYIIYYNGIEGKNFRSRNTYRRETTINVYQSFG